MGNVGRMGTGGVRMESEAENNGTSDRSCYVMKDDGRVTSAKLNRSDPPQQPQCFLIQCCQIKLPKVPCFV
ncbi:hypothetical protein E2C01_062561 [Portunus trituberculatus]|uniref:Uncharacterized protein n=1 Tax=Portunus trituberculatus TaxID=210409 RepID=A0A5B7H6Q1_PORTR|nr:hypothetical protein [Portunus trituberculatus]